LRPTARLHNPSAFPRRRECDIEQNTAPRGAGIWNAAFGE
jgi:hypothetical protein